MSLVDEYRRQYPWRDWNKALSHCPLAEGQRVLDLGCGPGDICAELWSRGASVTGVDANPELLSAAKERCPQCSFLNRDLRTLDLEPGTFDGLWCSFTAAYFTDFETVFARWATLLNSKGWVCLIDIDDLLGHEPLSEASHRSVQAFYEEALRERRYDFAIGRKLRAVLQNNGFRVRSFTLADKELSFNGPADPVVAHAWMDRFSRMGGLKAFLKQGFSQFEKEFLECITSSDHQSRCRVVCCIGIRDGTGS